MSKKASVFLSSRALCGTHWKAFPNLLSPSSKTTTALLWAWYDIMLVGKTFFGLGLQRARVLTFRSLLWSLADSGSLNHSARLLPARAHLYVSSGEQSPGTQHFVRLPTCAYMDGVNSTLPLQWKKVPTVLILRVTNCTRAERQVVSTVSTPLQSLRGRKKGRDVEVKGTERKPTYLEHSSSSSSTHPLLQKMQTEKLQWK